MLTVIYRKLVVERCYPSVEKQSVYSTAQILRSLGDLMRLDITLTPVKDHPIMLDWKLARNNYNYNKQQQKKRTCRILDLAVPPDHRVNLKESKKKELKKMWNIEVTLRRIVIGVLGTITEVLVRGLEDLEISGRVETTQTPALLRSARILRRILETWDLLSLKLQWKTISKHWCEKTLKE